MLVGRGTHRLSDTVVWRILSESKEQAEKWVWWRVRPTGHSNVDGTEVGNVRRKETVDVVPQGGVVVAA